jgi:O-antigen/teichoic acid export membrane protein
VKKVFALLASQGIQQTLITVVGNVLATGLSALALIGVSRLLGPEQFGVFSVGFAIIMILNKIGDLGLSAAILKFSSRALHEGDTREANQVGLYTLRIKLGFSVLLTVVGCALTPALSRFLHFSHPEILYLSFILNTCSTIYEQLLNVLQASHRFSQAVVTNALQSSLKLAGVIVFWAVGPGGLVPLFAFYMTAPLLPILLSSWLLPEWWHWKLPALSDSSKAAVWNLARHSAIGLITAGLIENIDILFVQRYLSPFETGLLGGVSRIAMMVALVAYSLGNVLYPRVARYTKEADIAAYLKKAWLVVAVAIGGWVLSIPFASLAIQLTVGPEYLPGSNILIVLMAAAFLTVATIPFLALFYSFEANWYFSFSGLLQLALIVVGNWWFVPEYGLAASAWTRLVTRVVLFVFTATLAMWLVRQKRYAKQTQSAD